MRVRPTSLLAMFAALGFVLASPASPAQGPAPGPATERKSNVPAPAAPGPVASSDALAALKALLERPGLVLSSAPDSATSHFGFGCRVQGNEAGKEWAWDLWAVRDGKRAVSLVRSGRGQGNMHTQAVICDGVFVCLDPERPGGLILKEGWWTSARVYADAKEFRFDCNALRGDARLLFDAGSIIRVVLPKLREVRVADDGRTLVAETERAQMAVTPTPAGSTVPCPVTHVVIPVKGAYVTAGVFDRHSAEQVAGLRPLTADAVKALGLPTRVPEDIADVARMMTPGAFEVDADRRHLQAAAMLSQLPRDADYRFPDAAIERRESANK